MILKRHQWCFLALGVIASVALACFMTSPGEDKVQPDMAATHLSGDNGVHVTADKKNVFGPGAMPANVSRHARTSTGVLALNSDGRLQIDHTSKTALDVLLSTVSLNPTNAEIDKLLISVREGLPEPEAAKAVDLLKKYIELRRAEAELGMQYQSAEPGNSQDYLKKLSALRREYFDAETTKTLFGKEEKQLEFALARSLIENDPTLSGKDRMEKIKALQESMPLAMNPQESGSLDPVAQMTEKVAALRAQGGSEREIRQLQEQYLSPESLRSMSEMASQNADWEQRYRNFSEKKKNVLSSTLVEADKQARIEALFREQYSESEISAAKAYDKQMSSRSKDGA